MATRSRFTTHQNYDMRSESQILQDNGRIHLPTPNGYLLSPPDEKPLDSFSTEASPSPMQQKWSTTLPPIQTGPSPPASPSTLPLPRIPALNAELSQSSSAKDPPLFSGSQGDREISTAPLFGSHDGQEDPPRKDSLSPEKAVRKSTNEFSIYETFHSTQDYLQHRQACIDELRSIRGLGLPQEPRVTPQLNKSFNEYSDNMKRSLHSTGAGISKPRTSLPKPQIHRAPRTPNAATPAAPRKAARSSAVPRNSKSQSVEPQARKRAPPSKRAPLKAEDKNWAQLPDYCPPISTLDGMPKALKISSWKGPPNDLSNDPDTDAMHPQEIEVAADLKLPGAQYMANKRRIFQARLTSLKDKKPFTKTAAQQACNIDVNKTSKLFEAFLKVGWFEPEHFEKFL